ncbi:MAG: nicotinate-nucleotide adenylyltransferase [Chloroflexi bacterium]|nr:nicotinate-nucleotide adenylyltransferase [Chloroflexota bacterium]
MSTLRRLGVLGGTFDPIHHAHLFAAEAAAAAYRLDKVLLVPAGHSPLKATAPAPAYHRAAMARRAAADNPLLEVDTVDVDRPPPSYSVDTIALLVERYSSAALYLILGVDALQDLLEWREPERLLDLCRLVVVSRPGRPLAIPAHIAAGLGKRAAHILLLRIPDLDISSTDLRRRFREGEPVRYLLPRSVEEYVRSHRLYDSS